jgi:hypothetical protein
MITLYPSWGPSCSRTTTCSRLCRPFLTSASTEESQA